MGNLFQNENNEDENHFEEPKIAPENIHIIKKIKIIPEIKLKSEKNKENIEIKKNGKIDQEINNNNQKEEEDTKKSEDKEENKNQIKVKKIPNFESYELSQDKLDINLTERIPIKKKEPKDSNPKIHILTSRTNGNINRLNLSATLKSEFIEVPRNKYDNIEDITLVWGSGMATGEYKFLGDKNIIKDNFSLDSKIVISEEEINNELNKIKKRINNNKKRRYEIIDKFYTLTDFKGKTIKKIKIQNIKNSYNYISNSKNTNNSINLTKPLDNYDCYIYSQINKLRTDPKSFIGIISEAKDNIKKDRLGRIIYNSKIKVALNSGETAFNETIDYLKTIKPMKPLEYNQMITVIPPRNESEILDKNDLNKKVEEIMDNNIINIKSFWRDVIKDPEISFILMIVDDYGNNKGMRRKDILNPEMKYIGISNNEIKGKFVCYITLGF